MTFSRSNNGLNNYPIFFACDLIAFTEGRENSNGTFDEVYYKAILSRLTGKSSIKIKCVGNKKNALDYLKQISNQQNNNAIVIVDKDLCGISMSMIDSDKLITTVGYSWENDFWTPNLCQDVIKRLTMHDKSTAENLAVTIRETRRVLFRICAVDAACQSNGKTIIPKKTNSCGINTSSKVGGLIPRHEIKRIFDSARSMNVFSCEVARSVFNAAMKGKPESIIQGHLWEHIALTAISVQYKNARASTSAPINMIKDMAFSTFIENPFRYISIDCKDYFEAKLSKLGLINLR